MAPSPVGRDGSHHARVLRHLGSGVSIMAGAQQLLTEADYHGLSERVGHARICGQIAEPLIDWTTCPGSTRTFQNDSHATAVLRSHHGFKKFKAAADLARRAGLSAGPGEQRPPGWCRAESCAGLR